MIIMILCNDYTCNYIDTKLAKETHTCTCTCTVIIYNCVLELNYTVYKRGEEGGGERGNRRSLVQLSIETCQTS